jgi:hypothetical protein
VRRYDTATSLAHLPNVRPLLEPIGGSTSQASREVSAPIEGEGELGERRAGAGPSARGATSSGALQEGRWRRSREPDRLGLSRRSERQRQHHKPGHRRWA